MALPTIEVEIETESGTIGRAAVDIGTSIGKYEALTLFDGGKRLLVKEILKGFKLSMKNCSSINRIGNYGTKDY